jgi:hypothetical protein
MIIKRRLIHPENEWIAKKLLKYSFLFFSLLISSLSITANSPLASKQQIEMFKNSQTCVVFEDGISPYNSYIKDAVQKYWKYTGYEFIDHKEFEERRTNPKYSFIVLTEEAFPKDPDGVKYSYIKLLLGDASGNLTRMPEYCSIPLSYSGDKETEYEYVIPAIVKFMQIHIKNLEKNRFPISLNGLKDYNKKGFNDKVLLLNKAKIAPDADSPEKIKLVYPNPIKLLTMAEMQEEIAANTAKTVFHFHVGPPENAGAGKCFEMIFDSEGNLYYYNFRKITNDNMDGFNQNDFKKIR